MNLYHLAGILLCLASAAFVYFWILPVISPLGLLLAVGGLLAVVAVDLRRNPA